MNVKNSTNPLNFLVDSFIPINNLAHVRMKSIIYPHCNKKQATTYNDIIVDRTDNPAVYSCSCGGCNNCKDCLQHLKKHPKYFKNYCRTFQLKGRIDPIFVKNNQLELDVDYLMQRSEYDKKYSKNYKLHPNVCTRIEADCREKKYFC